MRHRHVAVTMGSPHFRSIGAGSCEITQAWFPESSFLAPHTHGRSLFTIMLSGSFDTHISGQRLECTPGTIWTEPLGERHSNRAGRRGAHVLAIQPDPESEHLAEMQSSLFASVSARRHPQLMMDARRMAAEFDSIDALTPFMLESLAFSMFVSFARMNAQARGTPRWLSQVRDCLYAEFARPPRLADLARQFGVHATHICHEFRNRLGTTMGEYVRARRLEWAIARLVETGNPISEIAVTAGYSDQAHFSRACRAATGLSPAAYRRQHQVTARRAARACSGPLRAPCDSSR